VVSLAVESGLGGGLPCNLVDTSAFEHCGGDAPNNRIAPEQQAQMFRNLKVAMEFQGLKLVIERGTSPFD
jgi:hypothetical protein